MQGCSQAWRLFGPPKLMWTALSGYGLESFVVHFPSFFAGFSVPYNATFLLQGWPAASNTVTCKSGGEDLQSSYYINSPLLNTRPPGTALFVKRVNVHMHFVGIPFCFCVLMSSNNQPKRSFLSFAVGCEHSLLWTGQHSFHFSPFFNSQLKVQWTENVVMSTALAGLFCSLIRIFFFEQPYRDFVKARIHMAASYKTSTFAIWA